MAGLIKREDIEAVTNDAVVNGDVRGCAGTWPTSDTGCTVGITVGMSIAFSRWERSQ